MSMFFVSAVVTIAATLNGYLDLLISLTGSLASAALAIIFPPLLETLTYWPEQQANRKLWFKFAKNALIMLFGIIGITTGTVTTVINLILRLKGQNEVGSCPM